ncbi:hypothetical protein [Listeria grandensis]|uniref:hypothetical protein n=1 Tax=Listeria grandensis TaxID=1494963 RepID=UPI00164D9B50|nr:hypothetical protein [Listeria grandensis]MBC6316964.1 hypothetical protein [Listeria grandensis]
MKKVSPLGMFIPTFFIFILLSYYRNKIKTTRWGNKCMKKGNMFLGFAVILGSFGLFASSPVEASEQENEKQEITETLISNGVEEQKVEDLTEKVLSGEGTEADEAIESNNGEISVSDSEQRIYEEFEDGSFYELSLEEVPTIVPRASTTWESGTQQFRTIKVSHTTVWGTERFYVQVNFPLMGYSSITKAYNWYYLGAVKGGDYRGIYRKNETASLAAVAMQKLVVGIQGINYLAKLEFRMKGGKYSATYSS